MSKSHWILRKTFTKKESTHPPITNIETNDCGKSSATEGIYLKTIQIIKMRFKIKPTLVKKRKAFISVKNTPNTPKYHYFAFCK
jgi:hypothetical protein